MRRSITVLAAVVLTVGVGVFGAPSAQAQGGVTAAQVQGAINNVPQLTNSSANVASTSDADSAAITSVNGTQVDVPKSQAGNVQVVAGSVAIAVQLPGTVAPQNGVVTAPGVVAYPSGGNYANAVQADNGGNLHFLTVINNASAPEEYDYNLDLPAGSSITKLADGSLSVHTPGGDATIDRPWALDATGKQVYAQYLTDGYGGVSLIVNHWGENVTYPITADPWVTWNWAGMTVHLTRDETYYLAIGAAAALGARVGNIVAAGAMAAGGQALADWARSRGLCVAAWHPWAYPWWTVYATTC